MIGKTISHYKITDKLGGGGMGVVYKAQDLKLDRMVALKFLPPHMHLDEEAEKRFISEAKAASSFDHPNICTIHEIGKTDDDQLYIVMACYEGETLKKKLEKGQIKIEETINIVSQVAEGLNRAHQKGIVHRDIKPANIFIKNDGTVKILDFGLAKVSTQIEMTQMGTTIGTVAYMSPEQTGGTEVDQKTDIWSLGVVLYEMLTGEKPFQGDYEQAIIYSILSEEPRPISLENTSVSVQLAKVVTQALVKNPDERFQNADELLVELRAIENRFKEVNGKDTVSEKKESKRKFTYFFVGISVIIVLITLFFPKKEQGKSIDLIAVLPFSNNKPDPETDYLGFAIANQIIGDLVYLKNITVRPSSSVRKYEKQVIDPIIVGDDLKVDYILIGNYLMEANIIRLDIELVEANSNKLIWREPIEVDYRNAFELQDIVAQKVVEGLNVQFSQNEVNRIGKDIPDDPLAYEYYLRSISYPLSNEGDQLAIEMLNKSIELDSNYAPAYAQLGDRLHRFAQYGLLNPEETKRSENLYLKALSINEDMIYALASLAQIYTETDRIEKAVKLTRKMLEINPNNAEAHFTLGYIYRYAGMNREAIQQMEKAVTLDPKNQGFRSIVITYQFAGEYEKSFESAKLFDKSSFILAHQGAALFCQGNKNKAVAYFDLVIDADPDGLNALWVIPLKAYHERNIKAGVDALSKFEETNILDAEAWYYFAGNYALLGKRDGCIRALQRAVNGGFFNYPFMLIDSLLDSMRDDPEFQKVLEKAKEKHLAFKKRFF